MQPEPNPRCTNESVNVGQDYACSGFEVGRQYRFMVSAINCGDQEGEREIFQFHPQGMGFVFNLLA